MKITTRSTNPHTRTAKTPYTEAKIAISPRGSSAADLEQRNQEMAFLALLVRVLNPRIGLRRVNQAFRDLLAADTVIEGDEGDA